MRCTPRRPLSRTACQFLVWCLLVALPVFGVSSTLVELLGANHVQRIAARSLSHGDADVMRGWVDLRCASAGCAAAGGAIGLGSSPESVSGGALFAALIGTGIGAIVWLCNGAALVRQAKQPWLMILVRVAGSWTTASSVLGLALWSAAAPPSTDATKLPGLGTAVPTDTRK